MELTPLRQSLVGVPGKSGLSVEQRKRLTIAVELVANPSIVFMDEPTSGELPTGSYRQSQHASLLHVRMRCGRSRWYACRVHGMACCKDQTGALAHTCGMQLRMVGSMMHIAHAARLHVQAWMHARLPLSCAPFATRLTPAAQWYVPHAMNEAEHLALQLLGHRQGGPSLHAAACHEDSACIVL